jgi:hypothetical protein
MSEMDDVFQYLKEHGARTECEVCGQNSWSTVSRVSGLAGGDDYLPLKTTFTVSSHPRYTNSGPGMTAYVFLCTNCGNLRFHARAVVNPKKEGGSSG